MNTNRLVTSEELWELLPAHGVSEFRRILMNEEERDADVEVGANARQHGGDHYQTSIQHWDYVVANRLDYFQGQITKYVTRWKKKNGVEDLHKARHFLDKYLEEVEAGRVPLDKLRFTRPVNFDEEFLAARAADEEFFKGAEREVHPPKRNWFSRLRTRLAALLAGDAPAEEAEPAQKYQEPDEEPDRYRYSSAQARDPSELHREQAYR